MGLTRDNLFHFICFFSVILLLSILYLPATESRFLLDDYSTLTGLTEIDESGIANYVLGGFTGPTGRPISLLSFAIQADAWPDNPAAFKIFNLAIHVSNAFLLLLITLKLFSYSDFNKKEKTIFSCIVFLLWLLHPLHHSTIFYATQRMTELAAFFTLLTVYFYLHFRPKLTNENSVKMLIIISIGVLSGTCLSILSKENGILTLVYIYIIEITVLTHMKNTVMTRNWLNILLLTPVVILVLYFIFTYDKTLQGYEYRSYGVQDRLVTQVSVIIDYLRMVLLPNYSDFTFYHDDYRVIKDISVAPFILIKFLFLVCIILFAIFYRRKLPFYCFGILWFFCGHALESSHLNLEMFFEHRNYLPSYGLIVFFVWSVFQLYKYFDIKLIVVSLLLVFIINIFTVSILHIKLWQDPYKQVTEWVRLNPGSINATSDLALVYTFLGNYTQAQSTYEHISMLTQDSVYTDIQRIKLLNCYQNEEIGEGVWLDIIEKSKSAISYKLREVASLDSLVALIVEGKCNYLDLDAFSLFINTLIKNPSFASNRPHLYEFMATVELYKGNIYESLNNIRNAITSWDKPSYRIYEIRLLLMLDDKDTASERISAFKNKYYSNIPYKIRYKKILNTLENLINS
jgi:tetratricopeptide (TPR) repeat protein